MIKALQDEQKHIQKHFFFRKRLKVKQINAKIEDEF